MSKTQIIQNSLISGVLSKTLRGRIDINKYYSGVEQADNVAIMTHGGLTRRHGMLNALQSSTPTINQQYFDFIPKIIPYEWNNNKINYLLVDDTYITLYQDNVFTSQIDLTASGIPGYIATPLTQAEIDAIDFVQIENEIFIFMGTRAPLLIQHPTATTISVNKWVNYDMPIYDFTKGYAGVKEFYTGDGVEKVFTLLYSGDIFSVYVGGTKYTRVAAPPGANQYSFDSVAQTITFSTAPAVDIRVEVISGYDGLPYDSDTPFENIWSDTRGWPRTCTVHQSRLVLGGSSSKPSSVWQSQPGDYMNFNTGAGWVTDAIFDTLDTYTYNEITNVVSNRSLQVFTTNTEFYNLSNPITPANSAWKVQTQYGNIRIKTGQVDGATYYIDKNSKELRQFLYSFNEDAFTSVSVSMLASEIISNVVDICAFNGSSSDIANYIYVVNGDGTMAVLNTLRTEQINGWSKYITDGNIKRAERVKDIMYFIVERSTGVYFVEKFDTSVFMDHSHYVTGANTRVEIKSHLPATDLTKLYGIVVDGSYYGTALAYLDTGKYYVNLPIASVTYAEVGLVPSIAIKTMPLTAQTGDAGTILNQRKRVIRVILNLYESVGVSVDGVEIPDTSFPVVLDAPPTPYTGIKEIYMLGYSRTTQVDITQTVPLGFTLMQLEHELEY